MQLRWFQNEEGSTSLSVILGIVLSLALLASSIQWYWVNSSSSDIQAVADIAVLSAVDVTAKSVMVIQTLDAMLLTANLFGLVLHVITLVSGLLVVLTAPVGGAGASTFFERSVQINKEYSKKKRRFAQEAYSFASKLSDATPYLAMAQAYQVSSENSKHLEGFNKASYLAVALPFPAKGEVELSGFPEGEDQLLEEINTASEENRESAHTLKQLEDEIEAAIDECFRLDAFLPAGTTRPFWHPLSAVDDFMRGWADLSSESPPEREGLIPITDSSGNREKLQTKYRRDYKDLAKQFESEISSTFERTKSSEGADTADLSLGALLDPVRQERIYLVRHDQGEQRAYHRQSDCFGLSNAGEIQTYSLTYVQGDTQHPPCLICEPTHWRALEVWEQHLSDFASSWNGEAAALRRWYEAQESRELEQEAVEERTGSALQSLLEEAQSYLLGGRLRYTPAGARGYICIVMSTQERSLPAATLPALTGSDGQMLGKQLAMAGAKMMPSTTESTIPDLLKRSHSSAEEGSLDGFAALTRNLLDSSEGAGLDSDVDTADNVGILGFLLRIWGSCLTLYIQGSNELEKLMAGLPFGLDVLATQALRSFFDTAQISAPDLRRPVPTLVNTADVGDASVGGFEGRFVSSLAAAKDGLEKSGGASIVGLRENFASLINELDEDVARRIDELMTLQVLGVSIPLPFSTTVKNMAAGVFVLIRSKEEEMFAMLGTQ